MIIAIALVAALLGAMGGFLFDLLNSRIRVLEHVRQREAAATVIRQLDADLAACIVGDSGVGGGVRGEETQLRILTRGVASSLAPRGVNAPHLLGDLQSSEFRFDSTANRVEGRRGPMSRSDSQDSGDFESLEGAIYKLRFRYYDGTTWRLSYDSVKEGKLPIAVEVAMWFHPLPEQAIIDSSEAAPESSDSEQQKRATSRPSAANFDERAYAMLSDMDLDEEGGPPPSRVRVFMIPDPAGPPAATPNKPSTPQPVLGATEVEQP